MSDPTRPHHPLAATVGRAAAAHGLRTAGGAVVGTLGWPVIAGIVFIAAMATMILLASLIMSVSRMNADRATFVYQCQSRLGAAVGTTASVQVITRVAAPETSGAVPTLSYELRYLQPQATPEPVSAPEPAATPPTTAAPFPQRNP